MSDKPAFEILEANIDLKQLGQRERMTETDIQKIKKIYSFIPHDTN